ncbi:hypothetical protein QR685DRAFT_546987 [Neurospora intermedia]|uniref:Uncharacterized protein n=1 Tax=Neurospora intermedia TaxID=5142 RepID=A0ABR3D4S7_NEUIN
MWTRQTEIQPDSPDSIVATAATRKGGTGDRCEMWTQKRRGGNKSWDDSRGPLMKLSVNVSRVRYVRYGNVEAANRMGLGSRLLEICRMQCKNGVGLSNEKPLGSKYHGLITKFWTLVIASLSLLSSTMIAAENSATNWMRPAGIAFAAVGNLDDDTREKRTGVKSENEEDIWSAWGECGFVFYDLGQTRWSQVETLPEHEKESIPVPFPCCLASRWCTSTSVEIRQSADRSFHVQDITSDNHKQEAWTDT